MAFCRRRWPTRSASFAVSKYQPPCHAAHQTVSTVDSRAFPVAAAQVWNGLSEAVVSSSSLQTFRRLLKTHLSQLSYPHLIFWLFDWHRYSGPCSNVRYLGHSKNLCLLTYLLTYLLTNNNNTAGTFFSDAIKIDFQNSSMNCRRFGFDMQQKQKKIYDENYSFQTCCFCDYGRRTKVSFNCRSEVLTELN